MSNTARELELLFGLYKKNNTLFYLYLYVS